MSSLSAGPKEITVSHPEIVNTSILDSAADSTNFDQYQILSAMNKLENKVDILDEKPIALPRFDSFVNLSRQDKATRQPLPRMMSSHLKFH